jgi:hypothetical protein
MRRVIGRLTALLVKRLGPGLHADGGNLYLKIGMSSARSFIFRYERDGRQRDMGLGAADTVSLAEARQRAAEARSALGEGKDPIDARKASLASQRAAAVTFGSRGPSYTLILQQQKDAATKTHEAREKTDPVRMVGS